jgi:hypothetical protein
MPRCGAGVVAAASSDKPCPACQCRQRNAVPVEFPCDPAAFREARGACGLPQGEREGVAPSLVVMAGHPKEKGPSLVLPAGRGAMARNFHGCSSVKKGRAMVY